MHEDFSNVAKRTINSLRWRLYLGCPTLVAVHCCIFRRPPISQIAEHILIAKS